MVRRIRRVDPRMRQASRRRHGEEQHRQRARPAADGLDAVHEGRLGGGGHERVGRAVVHAAHRRPGDRVLLDQERGRQVQHDDQKHERDQRAVETSDEQPPGREHQQQVQAAARPPTPRSGRRCRPRSRPRWPAWWNRTTPVPYSIAPKRWNGGRCSAYSPTPTGAATLNARQRLQPDLAGRRAGCGDERRGRTQRGADQHQRHVSGRRERVAHSDDLFIVDKLPEPEGEQPFRPERVNPSERDLGRASRTRSR